MSDTTQRLRTNHIVRFRRFWCKFYGFLQMEGANSWGQVLVCCMQLSQSDMQHAYFILFAKEILDR